MSVTKLKNIYAIEFHTSVNSSNSTFISNHSSLLCLKNILLEIENSKVKISNSQILERKTLMCDSKTSFSHLLPSRTTLARTIKIFINKNKDFINTF